MRREYHHNLPAPTTPNSLTLCSFDYDVSPTRRSLQNVDSSSVRFYGYIPDQSLGRTIIFACLWLNSSCMLLLRSIAAAFLIVKDVNIFFVYWACEMGLYLCQKAARGDMTYWLSIENSAVSWSKRRGKKTETLA